MWDGEGVLDGESTRRRRHIGDQRGPNERTERAWPAKHAGWPETSSLATTSAPLVRVSSSLARTMATAPSHASPPWLPNPLMEEYVSSVTAALKVREDARTVQRMGWPRHGGVERGTQHELQGAYSCSVGRQPANRQSNRYTDVIAYDRTRVIPPGLPGGQYLNANWVRERFGGKWTIATQAPLPATAHSFLSLFLNAVAPPQELTGGEIVAAQTPRTIVQLTQNVERRVTKASPYFPAEVGQKMTWTPQPESDNRTLPSSILIELVATEQEDCWQHSTLRIAYANRPEEARLVRHLLFQVSMHVAILSTVLRQARAGQIMGCHPTSVATCAS